MPDWSEEIARRLSLLKLDSTREIEIAEELSQHLDDRFYELISGGATDEAARRDVLMELNYEDLLTQAQPGKVPEIARELTAHGRGGHGFFASFG